MRNRDHMELNLQSLKSDKTEIIHIITKMKVEQNLHFLIDLIRFPSKQSPSLHEKSWLRAYMCGHMDYAICHISFQRFTLHE